MLTRIYIDNFKGLVDFELKDLGAINLFLGENGAGKSTVFEALQLIRKFVGGVAVFFEFEMADTLTRWVKNTRQTFELDISGNNGIYKYKIIFEENNHSTFVLYEALHFNQQLLLKVEFAEAQTYSDDFSIISTYPFQSTNSILCTIPSKNNYTHLTWFREQFQQWFIIHPTPSIMTGISEHAHGDLDYDLHNFASWYRHLCQNAGQEQSITQNLKESLSWFHGFEFRPVTKALSLYVQLAHDNYHFTELSDGQRVLIALYTLMTVTRGQNYLLCLDEPENYLALPEIQPWLVQLEEHCETHGLQAMLISHHPELINYLGGSSGYWFSHKEGQPVTVKRLSEPDPSGISLSELIARGWLDE